jgi:hypothetical protein
MLKGSGSSRRFSHGWGLAALAVGLPFLVYLATLYPGVGDRRGSGDSIEFQLVGRVLTIPHEPGYPQYVLLSHLWSLLPLPFSLASKINLLSATFSVGAGLFLWGSARLLSGSRIASVLATWFVLLTPSVWLLSTQAEVYSLHLLWVSAVLWAALHWFDTGQERFLVALFFFYALSFGNHLTMITLLPALIFLVMSKDSKVILRWQNWCWGTLAIGVGLLQYGLLIWRSNRPHPALIPSFPTQASPSELLDYVTGGQFVERHFLKTGMESLLPRLWDTILHSFNELTLVFMAFCGVGFYLGMRRHRPQTVFLALVAGSILAFAAAYSIKDSLLYTMPAWLCFGILGAVGIAEVLQKGHRWRLRIVAALVILLTLLTGLRAVPMRVTENPYDQSAVIAAADAGSGILVAGRRRRARLLGLYYQYGEAIEKASLLDFRSLQQVLATGLEDSNNQILYFRDEKTARKLDRSFIDYSQLSSPSSELKIWVTRSQEPLERLELRPLKSGSVAVSLRERSLHLLGKQTLHLFLISAIDRRSKGYLPIDTEEVLDWPQRLQEALNVATPGDFVLLIAPRLGDENLTRVADLLESRGVDFLPNPPARRHTIAWWQVGGDLGGLTLLYDLAADVVLELDDP